MLAHAPRYDEPSAPPLQPPPPAHTRREGRLYIGRFLVPDRPFLLPRPCPACSGPALYDDGDLKCLWCARELIVEEVSPQGRVRALGLRHPATVALVRIAPGQTRRTARALSRADGATGLQARVLRLVPQGPDAYTVVEAISRTLAIRRELVRSALDALESHGLVERFAFNAGYRIGWRRARREAR
jgi:hypothetical protein